MSIEKPEIDFPGGEPPADLEIKDIWEGDGEVAQAGQTVTVHYVGVAFSTGEEFDASWNRGQPFRFPLGGGRVIKGWDQGVQWSNGKEFDSTYANKQLVSFALAQVVKGWSQGLTGKKVGSRVLIVIPPDLGYGDNPPQGSGIEKGATLVFTVDILAKM